MNNNEQLIERLKRVANIEPGCFLGERCSMHEIAQDAIAALSPVQHYEEQPDGTVIPVDPAEMSPVQSEEVSATIKKGRDTRSVFWGGAALPTDCPPPIVVELTDMVERLAQQVKELKTKAKSEFQLAQRNSAYTTKLEAQIKEYYKLCDAVEYYAEGDAEFHENLRNDRARIEAMKGEDDE